MPKIVRSKPQLVMKNGKPNAVIIDIKDYRKMLERLEDKDDLDDLRKIRATSPRYRKFDDFLAEQKNAV
jgi:PHD/YefM family antitoxin component YafN of YafNO toxin-antitoxin module